MKKLLFSILLMIVLATSAFATLTVTDLTLGDDGTTRTNPLADDDEDIPGDVVSGTVTVKNTGNATVSSITLDFGSLDTEFNMSFDETAFSLTAGQSKTITVNAQIPKNFDSIQTDVDNSQTIEAGSFAVEVSSVTEVTGKVLAEAESGISINDVEIIVDGESYDYDDDELEEIIPGSDVTIKFVVTNEFDKNSNVEQDVDVNVDSDNKDIDVDDSSDSFTLKEDDEETFETNFDIDWGDVDDGDDASITVEVESTDDNGATHTASFEFSLEVAYPDADVDVSTVTANPTAVCPGLDVDFSFEVENVGNEDQNIRTQIQQATLGWDSVKGPVKIEGRDDEDTQTQTFAESLIVPKSAKTGDYPVKVFIYYEDEDGDDVYEFQQTTVTVKDCSVQVTPAPNTGSQNGNTSNGSTSTGSSTTGSIVVTQPAPTTSQPSQTTPQTVVATAKPQSNDTLFVVGLIVLAVLLLAVILSLIVALVRK